jgi:hypothetical protein
MSLQLLSTALERQAREARQEQREQALRTAEALRREALDDLWRGANAALATGATQALRAATRLTARLRRRNGPVLEA